MSYANLTLLAGALYISLFVEVGVKSLERSQELHLSAAWAASHARADRALDLHRRAKAQREKEEWKKENEMRSISFRSYAKGQEDCY